VLIGNRTIISQLFIHEYIHCFKNSQAKYRNEQSTNTEGVVYQALNGLTHCETMFLFQFNRIMSENRKEQKLSIALIHSALINHTALIMCQRNFYNGVSRGLLKLEDKTSEQGWDTLRERGKGDTF
jgi:hypothetical protein